MNYITNLLVSHINLSKFATNCVEWNLLDSSTKPISHLVKDPHVSWSAKIPSQIEIHIDLPFQSNISKITFYSWKFPPQEFDIWYSTDRFEWKHLAKCVDMRSNVAFPIDSLSISCKHIKITFAKGRRKKVGYGSCRLNLISIYGLPAEMKNLFFSKL
jgi:hypothetical protein